MASVGFWMTGSGRSPTVMERGPLKIAARMMDPFLCRLLLIRGQFCAMPVLVSGDLVAPVDEVPRCGLARPDGGVLGMVDPVTGTRSEMQTMWTRPCWGFSQVGSGLRRPFE